MKLNRRTIILGAGAGLALAGAGTAWRVTRLPKTAMLPWTFDPAPLTDVRLDAFRYAILAPNPHNRQPWLIRLLGANEAILTCDRNKRLPETDPYDRQITIGFGAFIELARIAAAQRGVRMDIAPFPEGDALPRLDARPLARLTFSRDPAIKPDPLFAPITKRRSNKEPYDLTRTVSAALAAQIASSDGASSADPAHVAAFRKIILDSVALEQTTPAKYRESVDLLRIGHDAVDASPDGVDLTGPKMEAFKLMGLMDRATLLDTNSQSFKIGLQQLQDAYGTIPAMVWVTTPGNTRADQLEAGRRYVRMNLRATAFGVSMHPMSQSLQEYPEMAALYAAIHRLHGTKGNERVQMQARIGYGPAVGPAPRWPLEKHVLA